MDKSGGPAFPCVDPQGNFAPYCGMSARFYAAVQLAAGMFIHSLSSEQRLDEKEAKLIFDNAEALVAEEQRRQRGRVNDDEVDAISDILHEHVQFYAFNGTPANDVVLKEVRDVLRKHWQRRQAEQEAG